MLETIGAVLILWAIFLALWNKGNWFVPYMIAFGIVFLALGTFTSAKAQHVHHDEVITDERVAKFYDEWKRPPSRLVSCCSAKDCYAAQIRRNPNGGLEYLHKWSGTWAVLPHSLIESNQPDPRESPNTENHVCANENYPDVVYCAVLAGNS